MVSSMKRHEMSYNMITYDSIWLVKLQCTATFDDVTAVEVKEETTTGIGDQQMTESTMKVTPVIDSSLQHSATVDGEGMYSCSR